jgi:hypothetical protein
MLFTTAMADGEINLSTSSFGGKPRPFKATSERSWHRESS